MDNIITITMERFVQLIECEIKINVIKRRVEKEKIYISRDDILAMLDIKEDGDDE